MTAMGRRRGYVLILVFLVGAFLLTVAAYYLQLFNRDRAMMMKGTGDMLAAEAAKAGIEDALYHLKRSPTWSAGFTRETLPGSGAAYSMTFDAGRTDVPFSVNNFSGTAPVTGYRGRTVPPGAAYLVCLGTHGEGRAIEEAFVVAGASLFQDAAFVTTTIKISGGATLDSYDSAAGPYSETARQTGANLGSVSSDEGTVTLTGNSHVYGTITVGEGGTQSDSVKVTGGSTYLGFNTTESDEPQPIAPPSGTNLGSITANGGTTTLEPGTYTDLKASGDAAITLEAGGTYVFTGDVKLSGHSRIVTAGGTARTTVFVLGNISLSGAAVGNSTETAANLVIFGGSGTTDVKMSSGSGYFGLYAPRAAVAIAGGSSFYGAVVADALTLSGGSDLHYDKALQQVTGGGRGVTVTSRW